MTRSKRYNLLVVAHPDDEAIFFSGLLQNRPSLPWRVICITDGNGDGKKNLRQREFKKSLKLLKCKGEQWDFPDLFSARLNTQKIQEQLRILPPPVAVFTHSIVGDYGHPHHQDVSFAVHQAFRGTKTRVYSMAYNCLPDLRVNLNAEQFRKKTKLFSEIYFSETERFVQALPATSFEAYVELEYSEAIAVYSYFANNKRISARALRHYKWLRPFFPALRTRMKTRPF